ncbi:nickel-responsive transcriptional regulator NikR [Natronospora cellulosivora (SeqCode)]
MSKVNRFGVSIEKDLLTQFDDLIKDKYNNRSEAIRDMIREKLIEDKLSKNIHELVGSITLLYDHHKGGLTEKMLEIQHNYHHLFKSNLHLHLNHDSCLEIIIVKGKAKELKKVAGKLIGLKGVKHGKLVLTSSEEL